MTRHTTGHRVVQAAVLRVLRDEDLIWRRTTRGNTAGAPSARGGVREGADRSEPGLAAGLLRVRDHDRWDVEDRVLP